MNRATGHILKGKTFEIGGTHRIDLTPSCRAMPAGNSPSEPQVPAQAHVVERHPQYAVVEVTCACGSKMYVRCDYARTSQQVSCEPAEPARMNQNLP
ncbi:MAG TPA: hypothetical protein ENN81_03680 [Phycisphaerales bacterium]|nr:hypothetical protein [Phycisphaerales bacterium]